MRPLRSRRPAAASGHWAFTLMPASEALLDEETIKRFRARYREQSRECHRRSTLPGDQRRSTAGRDGTWLPLFEDKLTTLFDHLGEHDVTCAIQARTGAGIAGGSDRGLFCQSRRAMVSEPGSYRPLAASTLYLSKKEWTAAVAERPLHLTSPSPSPKATRSSTSASKARATSPPSGHRTPMSIEAVAKHVAKLRKDNEKSSSPAIRRAPASVLLACSTTMASPA